MNTPRVREYEDDPAALSDHEHVALMEAAYDELCDRVLAAKMVGLEVVVQFTPTDRHQAGRRKGLAVSRIYC